jgi:hypothetical protein
VFAAVLALVGCGSGDDEPTGKSDQSISRESSDATSGGEAQAGGNAPVGLDVDRSGWYAGFEVHVDQARLSPSGTAAGGQKAQIDLTLTNDGEQSVSLSTEWALEASGLSVGYSAGDFPVVPGGASADASVTFDVDDEYDLREATLVVGTAATTQVRIPLGDGDDAVLLEPATSDTAVEVKAGDLTASIETLTVRADDTATHRQADAGKAWLTISWSATDQSAGGYALSEATLRLVNGADQRLAPATYPSVFLGPGSTMPDLATVFPIDIDDAGPFELIVQRNVPPDDTASGSAELDVPEFG